MAGQLSYRAEGPGLVTARLLHLSLAKETPAQADAPPARAVPAAFALFLVVASFAMQVLGLSEKGAVGLYLAAGALLIQEAGGLVAVTSLVGRVTTAITVANSYKLQLNPTTGDTQDLCAATDIGTTDTLAGSVLQFGLATTTAPPKLISVGYGTSRLDATVTTGQIEHVSAGTDGAITWYVTWVPLTDGATLVAA